MRFILPILLGVFAFSTGFQLGPALPAGQVTYGINFSFLDVNRGAASECYKLPSGPIIGQAFLPRYIDPRIREETKTRLAQMKQAGFNEIRTIIYFGTARENKPDWFVVERPEDAASLVTNYAEDVKNAGFDSLYLVIGPQGTLSPKCRRIEYGDCFDKTTIPLTINFAITVRGTLTTTPSLRWDLAPELCITENLPQQIRENAKIYLTSIVSAYLARFASDSTTISCSIERFVGGRQSITEAYEGVGKHPSFYDIHAYHIAGRDDRSLLQEIGKMPDDPAPLVVGEISYADRDYLQTMTKAMDSVRTIDFWPLANHSSGCAVDTPPPYTLRRAEGLD